MRQRRVQIELSEFLEPFKVVERLKSAAGIVRCTVIDHKTICVKYKASKIDENRIIELINSKN